MTETQVATPTGPTRIFKLKVLLGIAPDPEGHPPYIWLERWNAFIVATIVAVGVPLLAFLHLSTTTRLTVAWIWAMFWCPFFAYFEGRELIGQMMGRGSIKQEQLSEQQDTAQTPFWGVAIAFLIWILQYLVHVVMNVVGMVTGLEVVPASKVILSEAVSGLVTTWIPYGWIEWIILIQVWFVTKRMNYIFYNVGNTFSKSAPMGERIERRG